MVGFPIASRLVLLGPGVSNEGPKLSEQVNERLYRDMDVGPLLEHPYDYLGDFVAQGKAKGWNPTAFYPTPHNVVELMVRMTMTDQRADGRDPRTAASPISTPAHSSMPPANQSVDCFENSSNILGPPEPVFLQIRCEAARIVQGMTLMKSDTADHLAGQHRQNPSAKAWE